MRQKIFLVIFVIFASRSIAQDIQLSQFYASPLYLNPAFAGSVHSHRVSFHERIQWPALDAKYITSLFSYDTYFSKHKSGFGLVMLHDLQGSRILKSSEAAIQYSYELPVSNIFTVRGGIQAGVVSRNINYSTLIFPDQLTSNGVSSPTEDPLANGQKINYLDFASGTVVYTDQVWFGFSAHHLNQPNQSFANDVSRLPVKYSFVAGYKISKSSLRSDPYRRNKDLIIIPTIHYKFQGKSDQLDAGIYVLHRDVIAGFWYRGIPIKHYERGVQNNESMIFLAGYKFKSLSFTYSYDVTISLLKLVRTAGSHEINITWVYHQTKKKPTRRLPCPRFYHN